MITGAFPDLSETFILQQLAGLLDRGHEVEILARGHPNVTATQDLVARYQLMERTRYLTPSSRRAAAPILLWQAKYTDLNDIVTPSWEWHQAHPLGYAS